MVDVKAFAGQAKAEILRLPKETLAAIVILGVTWGGVAVILYVALTASGGKETDLTKMTCEELQAWNDDHPGDGRAFHEAVSRDKVCPWAQAIMDKPATCQELENRYNEAMDNHAYTDAARATRAGDNQKCDVAGWKSRRAARKSH